VNRENLIISKEQSVQFAYAIYSDIANYIQEHQNEYNEFLKDYKKERGWKNVYRN
jgi:hypothetical protein